MLHHYILKSREEFDRKRRRGGGFAPTKERRLARYDDAFFNNRDVYINAHEDISLSSRRPEITALMSSMFDIAKDQMQSENRAYYELMLQA